MSMYVYLALTAVYRETDGKTRSTRGPCLNSFTPAATDTRSAFVSIESPLSRLQAEPSRKRKWRYSTRRQLSQQRVIIVIVVIVSNR